MRMKRDELFRFLEELTGDEYYVGLHGIADDSDIKNEFSNLSKEEKAENILKTGIINKRFTTMKLTCKMFGNLPKTYTQEKDGISRMINYSFYSPSGNEAIVVVAIPMVFENDDMKLFGGWIDFSNSNVIREEVDCITDELFKAHIPKEMILGYYTYNKGEDEISFILNDEHYSNLTDDDKDKFINDYFLTKGCDINLNDSKDNIVKQIRYKLGKREITYKMLKQLDEYLTPEFQEKVNVRNASRKIDRDIIPYTLEELENTPVENIEIERIIPNIDFILSNKYGIKEALIKSDIEEEKSKNLMNTTQFQFEGKDEDTIVEEFEKFIINAGNTLDNVYPYWYQRNYKYFNQLFIDKISKMKEERLNEIEAKDAPLKEREITLSSLEQEARNIAKTEQLVEINENVPSNENDDG